MSPLLPTSPKELAAREAQQARGITLGPIANQSRYAAYRVVVYRLNYAALKNKGVYSKLIAGEPKTFDDIFNIDPLSDKYIDQAEWFAESPESRITDLLTEYYDAIMQKVSDGLDGGGTTTHSLYKTNNENGLVSATDITPLVTSITTSINLGDPNGCNIQLLNPTLASYNLPQLTKAYNFNQWLQYMTIVDPTAVSGAALMSLKSFKIKEYDLVRVYMYNGDKPLYSVMDETLSGAGHKKNDGTDEARFIMSSIMPVAFTGMAVGIRDQNVAGQVASISVECQGMMRILANTSTVVDQSLCNQIVMQHGTTGEDLSMVSKPVKVWSNFYSDKHALDCFTAILGEYFKPEEVTTTFSDGTTGALVGGVPSIFKLASAMFAKNSESGETPASFNSIPDIHSFWPPTGSTSTTTSVSPEIAGYAKNSSIYAPSGTGGTTNVTKPGPSFVQILNLLLCYHVLKTRAGEMIYYLDDTSDAFPEQGKQGLVQGDRSINTLRPYMLMTKTGFQTYDAQYQSPYSVFETIKQSTYLEVFEDRLGTFHLRFPRYNYSIVDHEIPYRNQISATVNRNDSGNMNVVQAKWMVDLVGAMNAVPSRVYADPISIFKYGTRVTSNIENPNCISPSAADAMAKFYRYFYLGMQSRSAEIQCIGDPYTSPGHTVSFRIGYAGAQNVGVSGDLKSLGDPFNKAASTNAAGSSANAYIGYISSVEDSIAIDGGYLQKISAKFVRDASVADAGNTDLPKFRETLPGTTKQNLSASEAMTNKAWAMAGTRWGHNYKAGFVNGTSGLKDPAVWIHPCYRNSPRLASFQKFYSVQDLAASMALGLIIAEESIGEASDNGLIKADSLSSSVDDFIRMFEDGSKAWVELRAQLAAIDAIFKRVSRTADELGKMVSTKSAFGSVKGSTTTYKKLLDIIDGTKTDSESNGRSALSDISTQGITPDMAGAATYTDGSFAAGSIFTTGDLSSNVQFSKGMPTYKSTLSKVNFDAFISNIPVRESDLPSFYSGSQYTGVSLADIITIVRREILNKSKDTATAKVVANAVAVSSYIKTLWEIYNAIARGTDSIRLSSRSLLGKKNAGGMDLVRLGNVIVRMQNAISDKAAADKAAAKNPAAATTTPTPTPKPPVTRAMPGGKF